MTECNQEAFSFASHFSRRVEAGFTAGQVSSDGGAPLLREVDRKINLLGRLAGCFTDGRDPNRVGHTIEQMLSQRVYGLALGYEDLSDHEQLRNDPLFGLLSGKRDLNEPLAGKSTLRSSRAACDPGRRSLAPAAQLERSSDRCSGSASPDHGGGCPGGVEEAGRTAR